VDRLIEEQRIAREQEQLMAKQYNESIASADKLFQDKDYAGARIAYQKALQVKPGDSYASQKLTSIDNILAAEMAGRQKQVEDSYRSAMERGTASLMARDFSAATTAFQEALAIKPSDHSARSKLAETEALKKQQQESIAAEQARKKKYDNLISAADQFLAQNNYAPARVSYEQALEIMPAEAYPRQKIDEIIKRTAEQERQLAEKQANDHAYSLALANADKYYKAKDYQQARDEYARALQLKPDEILPKNKQAEMENLISLRQKEQNEAKARVDAYTAAMKAGNASFGSKDYASARISYTEALNHMPGDALAGDQIKKIDYILAEAAKVKQAEAARKASYESFIKSADNAYDAGNYTGAKEDYKKALALEPTSAYAKQRIARIDEINKTLARTTGNAASSPVTSRPKVVAAIPMGELNFKSESEKQKYLDELKQKYPDGITLEKYSEQNKETYRYIVVRDNQAQEFRAIKFTTFSGSQYSVNGKPITQQYFLSQTRPRQGETYQEINMQ
jgi:tetratricopeptide (TPR) repeat protein